MAKTLKPTKPKSTLQKPVNPIFQNEMWADELELLYDIVRNTELEETTKWGGPCFTINGKNVLGLGGFKSYVGIWFHQGALLKDPQKVLINASEGKTKALRQWRFQSKKEINPKLVKAYVLEAIENAKQGKEIKPAKQKQVAMPDELKKALAKDKKLNALFTSLTPFRQREYMEYIGEAKQEKTRLARVEKSLPLILKGIGLHDKYR